VAIADDSENALDWEGGFTRCEFIVDLEINVPPDQKEAHGFGFILKKQDNQIQILSELSNTGKLAATINKDGFLVPEEAFEDFGISRSMTWKWAHRYDEVFHKAVVPASGTMSICFCNPPSCAGSNDNPDTGKAILKVPAIVY
jgi:hypothetical protein